jgi:ABC-type protease/lipase transport system fused ATPase/permease subunit
MESPKRFGYLEIATLIFLVLYVIFANINQRYNKELKEKYPKFNNLSAEQLKDLEKLQGLQTSNGVRALLSLAIFFILLAVTIVRQVYISF